MTDLPRTCSAYKEELFGPVFNIFRVKTHEEAQNLANKTEYGLGASIFTKNLELAQNFAKNIEAGMVFINSSTFSDPNLPYGGSKNSGYGRTSAWEPFYEFTNHKVIANKI
jgi:succinate-semialdehyde dehydrogenase/glutarate-semialdehyde dehydrogenase